MSVLDKETVECLGRGPGSGKGGLWGSTERLPGRVLDIPFPGLYTTEYTISAFFLIRMHARKQNGELSSGRRRRSSDRRFVRSYFVHTGCTALQPSCHEECWTHSCSKGRHGMRKKPISDRHKDRQAGTGGFLA